LTGDGARKLKGELISKLKLLVDTFSDPHTPMVIPLRRTAQPVFLLYTVRERKS